MLKSSHLLWQGVSLIHSAFTMLLSTLFSVSAAQCVRAGKVRHRNAAIVTFCERHSTAQLAQGASRPCLTAGAVGCPSACLRLHALVQAMWVAGLDRKAASGPCAVGGTDAPWDTPRCSQMECVAELKFKKKIKGNFNLISQCFFFTRVHKGERRLEYCNFLLKHALHLLCSTDALRKWANHCHNGVYLSFINLTWMKQYDCCGSSQPTEGSEPATGPTETHSEAAHASSALWPLTSMKSIWAVRCLHFECSAHHTQS